MADIIRLSGDAPGPETSTLPHNVEGEAALLGALMSDNRLAEDVQMKLRPDHFFEPLHARIYEQILRLIDRNMIASPVTLRPLFEADEEMKELGGPSYLAQLTRMAVEMAEKALNTGGGLSGVTTGLDSVNAKTGGLHHSDLIILAGRPGMGKTSLATNMAFNAAQRFVRDQEDGIAPEKSAGAGVAFFSLEMSAD